ncbi:MAG: SIR2 family protein, partial [Acidobacteria bacterium]|nr:SIR2 family protein [Acidobacteriota bacterium]
MNVYVLGAGVSREVGYPLTRELVCELDRSFGRISNGRSSVQFGDWENLKTRLREHADPQIRHSYATGDLETLITLFDLTVSQYERSLEVGIQKEGRIALGLAGPDERSSLDRLNVLHKDLKERSEDLREMRRSIVLWLTCYFDTRHHRDLSDCKKNGFDVLRKFARRLRRGRSVIITLNYDATIERVLMEAGVWTPADGYAIPTAIVQNSRALPSHSKVKVLKLHGSIGWYANQDQNRGKCPLRLSHAFLKHLGLWSNFPSPRHIADQEDERAIILPTYLKNFDDP